MIIRRTRHCVASKARRDVASIILSALEARKVLDTTGKGLFVTAVENEVDTLRLLLEKWIEENVLNWQCLQQVGQKWLYLSTQMHPPPWSSPALESQKHAEALARNKRNRLAPKARQALHNINPGRPRRPHPRGTQLKHPIRPP